MSFVARVPALCLLALLALMVSGCLRQEGPSPSDQARDAVRAGDHNRAVVFYNNAINSEGERYEFFLGRGRSYAALRRYDEALNDLDIAARLRPSSVADVARERAPILVVDGKYDAALRDVETVLTIEPSDRQFLYYKGICLQSLTRYDEALEAYLMAGEQTPKKSALGLDIGRNKARCHHHMKAYSKALEVYLGEYLKPKQATGIRLTDEDYYWAGALYKINLREAEAAEMWSHLSMKYKKEKRIE